METLKSKTSSSFLRRVLYADAATSAAAATLMIAAASPLQSALGVPAALLRYSGLALLPFVVLVLHTATRPYLSTAAVWSILTLNLLWVAGSVLVMTTGWIDPTAFGNAFIAAQAIVVALFADFQYVGLRKLR
jgi:hypothetical protein